MNKEKQIEEMAQIIALKAFEQAHLIDGDEDLADIVATDLYEKGYRKASDVAREIFEEIERFLYMHFRFCKEEIGNDDTEYVKGRLELNTQIQNLIAELKKKYTEEGK